MRVLPLAALLLVLLPAATRADIWQWTDAQGAVRYTPDPDHVPSSARGTLVKIEPGMPAQSAAEPATRAAPAGSGPIYAPKEELAADPFNAPRAARNVEVTEVPEPAWAVPGEEPAATSTTASPAPGTAGAAAAAGTAGTTAAAPAPPTPTASAPPAPSAPVASAPSVSAAPPEAGSDPWATSASPPAPAAAPAGEEATPAPVQTASARVSTPGPDPWLSAAAASAGVTAAAAKAPPPPPPPKPVELTPEQRSRRDELEALIAGDEETLKQLLSDASIEKEGFEKNEELRTIAQRLPQLQAELKALEEGRVPPAPEKDGEEP